MSWTSVKADGSGGLEFRLAIEGLPYQFCTNRAAEQTLDGQEWIAVMDREGIGWSEDCQVAYSELETTGITVKLVDRQSDDAVTKALAWKPSITTWLSADLDTSATTAFVLSTSGMVAGDYVHVGTETMSITTVSSSTKLILARAEWDTTAQAHYTGDGDALADAAVHVDRARSIEGRRAYLYAYGDGDDPIGAGTQIFRGVLTHDARMEDDGSTWTLQVGSITHLFNQDLGAETPTAAPRGIYYSYKNPLTVAVREGSGTSWTDTGTRRYARNITGFFVDNHELVREINTGLEDATSGLSAGWVSEYRAVTLSDGGAFGDVWGIEVTTPGASPVGFAFRGVSSVDNVGSEFGANLRTTDGLLPGASVVVNETYTGGPWPDGVSTMVADGACTVPRGHWGDYAAVGIPADAATYPTDRLYVGGSFSISGLAGEAVVVDWGDGNPAYLTTVASVNVADRWVQLVPPATVNRPYSAAVLPELRFPLGFSFSGGLKALKDGIIAAAPTEANRGRLPFIIADDIGDWDTAIAAAESTRVLQNREYLRVPDVTLGEYLTPEFRIRGLFPTLDATGKLRLKQIRVPVNGEPTDHAIGADDILIGSGFPSFERVPTGTVNTIEVLLGYDPVTEDRTARPIEFRDVSARSERKQGRTLKIEPFSRSAAEYDTPPSELALQLADAQHPTLGIFAHDYAIITFDVHLGMWDVLCGDTVTASVPIVPNPSTGGRGITTAGLVVSRAPQLDSGRITLGILISLQNLSGYAPTAGIASETNTGGNTWELDVIKTDPSGYGFTLIEAADSYSDHFAAGMNIEIWQFDSDAPTKVTGAVDAVDDTGALVTVTMDSVWVPSTDDWVLKYADAVTVTAVTAQSVYAFFGDVDGKVSFSTGDVPAYEYTP